jgi:hypothetical protein
MADNDDIMFGKNDLALAAEKLRRVKFFAPAGLDIFRARDMFLMEDFGKPYIPLCPDLKPREEGQPVAYDRMREVKNWYFINPDTGKMCMPALKMRFCGDNFNSTKITQVTPDGWLLTESGAVYKPMEGSRPKANYQEYLKKNPNDMLDNEVLAYMAERYPDLFDGAIVQEKDQVLMFKMKPAQIPYKKAGNGMNSMVSFYNDPNYGKDVA